MREKITMKELPASEKPYEKCMKSGAVVLSDAELLSVILKTGTKNKTSRELAEEVLSLHPVYKGILGLHHLSFEEYCSVSGIGRVKAVQLLCVAELAKRMARETKGTFTKIACPKDAAGFFMEEMRNLETEHLYAAYLNAAGQMLNYRTIFVGTVQTSLANPREILRYALRLDAASIIVLHNHPSGDPTPSSEDLRVTKQLADAALLVGIPLTDHIIIGDNQYVSLRERGYI